MANLMDEIKSATSGLVKRGRRGLDSLAGAVDERTQVNKLNARMRKLNAERADLLMQIGRKVYVLHTRGGVENKSLGSDCERIDALDADMAGLQERIEEVRRSGVPLTVTAEVEDDTPLGEDVEEPEACEEAPAADEIIVSVVDTPEAEDGDADEESDDDSV